MNMPRSDTRSAGVVATLAFAGTVAAIMQTPVSYTHLTLPTICSV